MYIKQDVYRPFGNPGVGIRPNDMLSLVDVEDIASFPSRDDKGVVINQDIVLLEGCYAYSIYMTPGSVELTSAADGDVDQVGFKPSIKFKHPGNETEVREFKANSINRKFIILLHHCSTGVTDLIGSPCNPCRMVPSYTGNNESNFNEFTFEQISKGDDIAIYRGYIAEAEASGIFPTEGDTLQVNRPGRYNAYNDNVTVEKISGGYDGMVINIFGTENPGDKVSCDDGESNIMLRQSLEFIAAKGSMLTLRAFDKGRGNLVWIEQSRYVHE